MNDATHAAVGGWANFYLITSSAAAALLGLQFVVQTLHASDAPCPRSASPILKRLIAPSPQTQQCYGAYVASQIAKPKMTVMVAERAGDVIGYAWAGIEGSDYMALRGPAGVLYDIVVDPAHRGQGVGQLLLDDILATLSQRGAPRVVLSTAARNESAQGFFARSGFRETMIEMTREFSADGT